MKKAASFATTVVIILVVVALRCSPIKTPVPGGPLRGTVHALRVFNGSRIVLYNSDGSYALTDAAHSVASFSSVGNSQQLSQSMLSGATYFGTATCGSGCNQANAVNVVPAASPSVAAFSQNLASGGSSIGSAVNDQLGTVYMSDTTATRIYFLNSATLGFGAGGVTGFNPFPTAGVRYVGVDQASGHLLISGTGPYAYFADAATGAGIGAALNVTSANCLSGNLGFVAVNSNTRTGYMLCGGSVIYFVTGVTPGLAFASAASSTFLLTSIITAADITFNSTTGNIYVVGNHAVTQLNGASGNTLNTADIGASCTNSNTPDLRGVAYNPSTDTVFVSDFANSKVYLLTGASLAFKTAGSCASSFFSTVNDAPAPTKITYY